MNKPPAFQFYAADFDMDTGSWTPYQVGIYLRLLIYQWINGPLPVSIPALARIARTDVRNMHKSWTMCIAKKYVPLYNDRNTCTGWVNERLEMERQKQNKYRELQAERGKLGSDLRWHKDIAVAIAPAIQRL